MNPSRREFLKMTAAGGAAAAVFGFDIKPAYAQLASLKIARASETRSTCPYCSVSCGVIIYTIGDRAKNVTPQETSSMIVACSSRKSGARVPPTGKTSRGTMRSMKSRRE